MEGRDPAAADLASEAEDVVGDVDILRRAREEAGGGGDARERTKAGGKRALFSHVRRSSCTRESGRSIEFRVHPRQAVEGRRTVLVVVQRGNWVRYSKMK